MMGITFAVTAKREKTMTCKDCIHFGICRKGFPWADGKGGGWCEDFKNKSDYAEVKHGYNKTSMHPVDEFVCSKCGFICTDYMETVYDEDGEYTYYREYEFNYCPNCGAKMDGRSDT